MKLMLIIVVSVFLGSIYPAFSARTDHFDRKSATPKLLKRWITGWPFC